MKFIHFGKYWVNLAAIAYITEWVPKEGDGAEYKVYVHFYSADGSDLVFSGRDAVDFMAFIERNEQS